MGGSSKTTTASTVPAWVSQAEQDALARAQSASRIGNVGYYGPDVAAMTPSQIAAMQGTNMAASAFGMPTVDVAAGMPTATNYGGMNAYSSGAGYDAALAELKSRFPGQFDAIMSMFINPVTGAGAGAAGAGQTQMGMPVQKYAAGYDGGGSGGGGGGSSYVGSGTGNLSMLRANLPGGINTDNPESLRGRLFGGLINAISPQREPTASMRPPTAPARPSSPTKTTSAKTTSAKSTVTKDTGRR